MFAGLDSLIGPSFEIVVVGNPGAPDTQAILRGLGGAFLPSSVVLLKTSEEASPAIEELAPFTAPLTTPGGRASIYVCSDFSCSLPTSDLSEAHRLLGLP